MRKKRGIDFYFIKLSIIFFMPFFLLYVYKTTYFLYKKIKILAYFKKLYEKR